MSTKAELRDLVLRESRIKNSTTQMNDLVDRIIEEILTDYCNKSRYQELLQIDVSITLVAATGTYSLPADVQNLVGVRYGRGPNATYFQDVLPKPETVHRSRNVGWPRYFILAGNNLMVFPYGDVLDTDTMNISYYANPVSLFNDDTDEFPIPKLESAVKKDAIARVQRFHSSNQDAQLTDADSQASFIAAESSN